MQSVWQGVLASVILIGIILVFRRTSAGVEQSAEAKKFGLPPGSLFVFVLFVGFFLTILLLMGACPQ